MARSGGFNGRFLAAAERAGPDLRGTVVPMKGGTGIRITSGDAGGILAAAGIFGNARGGDFELQLTPLGPRGQYRGQAKATTLRVRNAPLLAELLSAVSVVGLLEQLNGEGLLFAEADADFRLTPAGVEVRRGAAVGPSMGVSMAGTYDSRRRVFNLQGVISPIYLLNGIGPILTAARARGCSAFNYGITGHGRSGQGLGQPAVDPDARHVPRDFPPPGAAAGGS
ncbi:MAG: AsmA-like C-terminal region-containing protein [Gemmobacter sp.]|nr:AsmA-like C-terminal region-containing protein [Gemmobacter sp.]